MSSPAPLLAVESLSLNRGGRQLLSDFTLQVSAGELVYLEGENGSGKTSLLRILAGLSRHTHSGRVYCQTPLLYLGHRPGIKALLTPRENLAWYCGGHGGGDSSLDPSLDGALEAVGLYGYEDVLCRTLSAGQQRRVHLARLYLDQTRLWLLDEPFTSIDRHGVQDLGKLLQQQLQRGGAVIMTSHQELQLDCDIKRVDLAAEVAGG